MKKIYIEPKVELVFTDIYPILTTDSDGESDIVDAKNKGDIDEEDGEEEPISMTNSMWNINE